MKTRIFLILLLIVSNKLFSQNFIKGTVSYVGNSFVQEPISNAEIRILEKNESVKSDSIGRFIFQNISNGKYKMVCIHPDFESIILDVELTKSMDELNFVFKHKTKNLEEVSVSSVRAGNGSPTTFTNIGKEQIKSQNFGQDLPYLLESTPSTVVTSDAGAGVGYTGVRIRGVDPTRTNVTVNGIPLNDSESHGVFWVNMPDFSSSVDNMQIQRGVGTSTNGAAAFGASINIQTDKVSKEAYAIIDNSVGSFNTLKNSVKVGTGLMKNNFAFDMRLSNILSDGYVDRASSDLKAYYFSGTHVGKKSLLRANVFSGKEITYQAWYGIPESKLRGNEADLTTHYYNNMGFVYKDQVDSLNLYNSGNRTYNYYGYKNEVDNYRQTHYQLLYNYAFNPNLKLNLAAFFTHGRGYYEQYRKNEELSAYNLNPVVFSNDTVFTSDFIRRRWLKNDFFGGVFSLDYVSKKGMNLIFGGGLNQYNGNHFGEIIWAQFASNSTYEGRYYDNDANKTDGNIYTKLNKRIQKFTVFADLQVRTISYSYLGIDQKDGALIEAQQVANYSFFNPKAGLTFDLNQYNQFYASFSVANREPVRDDFRENYANNRPKHETLYNSEVGYRLAKKTYFVNANYYLMYYKNQLVLTGQINDVGGYTRTNVNDSYRSGIEIEGGKYFLANNKLLLKGNATLSQNTVVAFTESLDDYDNGGQQKIQHKNTNLAFSPNLIASLSVSYEVFKGFKASLLSKFVSKQYLDNTTAQTKFFSLLDDNSTRMLNSYYITNLTLSYTTQKLIGKEVQFGLLVNNLFNYKYENNGYTWGYQYGGKRIDENYYFPQAGTNVLGRVLISF